MKHRKISKFLVAAGLCLATVVPLQADVSAVQCNVQRDGVFVPVLHIDFGEQKVSVVLGERGLTRADLYNAEKIEAYLRRTFVIGDAPVAVALGCGAIEEEFTLPDIPIQEEIIVE